MEKIYISLGFGCQVATNIKELSLRQMSLPFDWVVPYSGVSDIIKNNFSGYIPDSNDGTHPMSTKTHTLFPHNKFPLDNEKMQRRIDRFLNLLNAEDKELIFLKRGHMDNHHGAECLVKHNWQVKNDIDECEEIFSFLKDKYPKLNFKIILLLLCSKCFNVNNNYKSNNIQIHNIAYPNMSFFEKDKVAQEKLKNILINMK